MSGSDRFPLAVTVARSAFGPLQSLLRCGQPLRGGTSPAGIVDVLTVAGGGETDDPDVDAGLAPGRRYRIGRHVITREHQQPAPPGAFDLDCLHPPRHLAVL